MSEILRADTVDAAGVTHDQFVELLCADEDLLRAEFDAIIAEEWPSPPPADPDPGADDHGAPHPDRRRREAGAVPPPRRPRHPGVGGWARQRSPPAGPRTRHAPTGEAGDVHT